MRNEVNEKLSRGFPGLDRSKKSLKIIFNDGKARRLPVLCFVYVQPCFDQFIDSEYLNDIRNDYKNYYVSQCVVVPQRTRLCFLDHDQTTNTSRNSPGNLLQR